MSPSSRRTRRPATHLDSCEAAVVNFCAVAGVEPPPTAARLLREAPQSFGNPEHGRLAARIHELRLQGVPAGPDTLAVTGSPEWLRLCNAQPGTPEMAEYHAGTVWSAHQNRQLAQLGETLKAGLENGADHAEAIRNAKAALDAIQGEDAVPDALPAWEDFADLAEEDVPTPPALVDGLIRRGEKCVLGGASKSFKSWGALNLAVSIESGTGWLGRTTTRGTVLVVNLELPRWCLRKRVLDICAARGLPRPAPGRLLVWNLRDRRASVQKLHNRLKKAGLRPDLVIVDPFYKLLHGRVENAAEDMGALLDEIGEIGLETGAAVVLPCHFAKGNAAGKEAMDRISGSGVFARDPDSILTLTKHEEDGAFTLESSLRTFPPCEPFAVRWFHPLFTPAPELDPAKLKQPANQFEEAYTDDDILAPLREAGREQSFTEWADAAEESCGIKRRTFAGRVKKLLNLKNPLALKSTTTGNYYAVRK